MKNALIIISLATLLFSCDNQTSKNMADNEKLVLLYFEHFNNHEWDKMAELYSEEPSFKDPSLGQGIVKQTREQITEKYAMLGKMFPDVTDKIEQIYPSGDNHIIVEFVSSGTSQSGSVFELPICTVFTIIDGKITADFTYYDNFEQPAL